jgi:2-polyprenyl-6-methoxyphenol hydroxylase-like FAD-dependent oxidoreductase
LKPGTAYFGVGLNSALEDVMTLNTALDACKDNVPAALAKYSSLRAKDTEAIVQMSVKFDGGFFSFVLPLIVDSVMHKALPFLFSPNSLAAIQNPKLKYSQIRRRKRFDRVLQFALLGSVVAAISKAVLVALAFVKSLLPVLKKSVPFFA